MAAAWRCTSAGRGFTGAQDIIPQVIDDETASRRIKNASAGLVREMVMHGTADDVIDQIAEWRDHGVRHVVVSSYNALRRSAIRGLTADTSLIRAMRGLCRL